MPKAKEPVFSHKVFQDETAAREALEAARWPDGPVCPHCGNSDPEKIAKVEGAKQSHRPGLFYCVECAGQFTVKVGTVFERSKVPLTKWWMAAHMLNAGKRGVSAHEIHRVIGVTYKTAWFMMHRLREAMKDTNAGPLGGGGKIVQADETYIGNTKRAKSYKKGLRHKRQIVALVEPKGKARVFHVKGATAESVRDILVTNVDRKSELHTDESRLYTETGKEFADHKTVRHGWNQRGVYVGPEGQTTNHVENFFGNFKRGMKGVYSFCSEQHLNRYLTEFEFRFNNRLDLGVGDKERTLLALKGIEGKRLTYRRINGDQV
ncbi:MAG: IS1595 family transposase [Xanthobacteraceae bacterium]|nr:IS1595 family transposase [Xanthobacteraceae bacterium]